MVTISVLLKSILPSPGWGIGNPTPAPAEAGTTGKVVPEGITTFVPKTEIFVKSALAFYSIKF